MDVQVRGEKLYAAQGSEGLVCYEVDGPTLQRVTSYETSGTIRQVRVAPNGRHAVVHVGGSGYEIVDVSDWNRIRTGQTGTRLGRAGVLPATLQRVHRRVAGGRATASPQFDHSGGSLSLDHQPPTLALVLFSDSANSNLGVLRRVKDIPIRLLMVGLPLTIAAGFGVGCLLFEQLTFIEIALLATMLAPTDAALGQAVVTNESVPASVRESLNVESGLNDGICVPVLLVFLALASGSTAGSETASLIFRLPLQAIGIGATVGLVLAAVGAVILRLSGARGWITGSWVEVPVTSCPSTSRIRGTPTPSCTTS
jgi:hypothetical protein